MMKMKKSIPNPPPPPRAQEDSRYPRSAPPYGFLPLRTDHAGQAVWWHLTNFEHLTLSKTRSVTPGMGSGAGLFFVNVLTRMLP